ncbi:MAG: ribosome hibernation-promoting factor, HPF/YfiA family [Candidatus Limnocylindria bacterium]
MKTTVNARNAELSDRLRSQIDRKLRRLDRLADDDAEASLELTTKASRAAETANVAEVTLLSHGSVLRSASSGPTMIAAIDRLLDKLERQLIRARERPRAVRDRHADEAKAMLDQAGSQTATIAASESEVAPSSEPSVVKVKRFDMVPMFEEDAIARMEELGHAFFVFLNAEGGGVCVVYRRSGGGYGMIEPVIAAERRR